MGRKMLTIAVLAVMAGCAMQQEPAPPAPAAPPAPSEDLPPRAQPQPDPRAQAPGVERLRGAYSSSGGWTLCGAAAPQSLRVTSQARSTLEPFVAQHPQFFLDGWGRRSDQGLDLLSVERMHTEGPGCQEPLDSFVWVAHGQEPFWAFAITNTGMRFKPAGEPARTYPYVAPSDAQDQVVYAGQAFRLTLRRQACASSMADARYAWSAELQTGGRTWRGCAWQGLQAERPAAGVPAS